MSDQPTSPIRVQIGGYTADVARLPDGGISVTVYLPLVGAETIKVPATEWRRIVEYAPPPIA